MKNITIMGLSIIVGIAIGIAVGIGITKSHIKLSTALHAETLSLNNHKPDARTLLSTLGNTAARLNDGHFRQVHLHSAVSSKVDRGFVRNHQKQVYEHVQFAKVFDTPMQLNHAGSFYRYESFKDAGVLDQTKQLHLAKFLNPTLRGDNAWSGCLVERVDSTATSWS